jgi:hypothetical protein
MTDSNSADVCHTKSPGSACQWPGQCESLVWHDEEGFRDLAPPTEINRQLSRPRLAFADLVDWELTFRTLCWSSDASVTAPPPESRRQAIRSAEQPTELVVFRAPLAASHLPAEGEAQC